MLQHRSTSVQPSNRRWFVSSRSESVVIGYRSDHWRRVWERGQIVADVTLYLVIGDIESLILWRQISMICCIQHDMIALGEPVIIRYELIPVTLAALSFSSAARSSCTSLQQSLRMGGYHAYGIHPD